MPVVLEGEASKVFVDTIFSWQQQRQEWQYQKVTNHFRSHRDDAGASASRIFCHIPCKSLLCSPLKMMNANFSDRCLYCIELRPAWSPLDDTLVTVGTLNKATAAAAAAATTTKVTKRKRF